MRVGAALLSVAGFASSTGGCKTVFEAWVKGAARRWASVNVNPLGT